MSSLINVSMSLSNSKLIQFSLLHSSKIRIDTDNKRSKLPIVSREQKPNEENNFRKKTSKFGKAGNIPIKNFKDNYQKNFMMRGKSEELMTGKEINEDLDESINKMDDNIELYSMNPKVYHDKAVYDDISNRKRIKFAIIRKRINKIEGKTRPSLNLLTWDAKEQIKHLNLNDPGKN